MLARRSTASPVITVRRFWFAIIKRRARMRCRESSFSPLAHRGGRVIGTDTLCISLVLQVSSDGQEREQGTEDNPNVNAHQGSPILAHSL
jgi:hypothetical protein